MFNEVMNVGLLVMDHLVWS